MKSPNPPVQPVHKNPEDDGQNERRRHRGQDVDVRIPAKAGKSDHRQALQDVDLEHVFPEEIQHLIPDGYFIKKKGHAQRGQRRRKIVPSRPVLGHRPEEQHRADARKKGGSGAGDGIPGILPDLLRDPLSSEVE